MGSDEAFDPLWSEEEGKFDYTAADFPRDGGQWWFLIDSSGVVIDGIYYKIFEEAATSAREYATANKLDVAILEVKAIFAPLKN